MTRGSTIQLGLYRLGLLAAVPAYEGVLKNCNMAITPGPVLMCWALEACVRLTRYPICCEKIAMDGDQSLLSLGSLIMKFSGPSALQ